MRLIILLSLVLLISHSKAQVTLEYDYDSSATYNVSSSKVSQLMLVNFEVSGERYVKINRSSKSVCIYDLNHALLKTISLVNLPMDFNTGYPGDVLYLSEHLFNSDSKIEFLYFINTSGFYSTSIYNEDDSLLFTDIGAPLIKINFPSQQYPIFNTSQGTKMILSYSNGHAKVFGLAGTLTTAIAQSNQNLMQAQGLISNPAPNPVLNTTRIDYALPKESNRGEIVFYDLQGIEIMRFKVDNTFNHLLLSTADIPAGTYYYQLETTGKTSAGKKLVVIK